MVLVLTSLSCSCDRKSQPLDLRHSTYPLFTVCFDLNTLQLQFHCKANAASPTANRNCVTWAPKQLAWPPKWSRAPLRPQPYERAPLRARRPSLAAAFAKDGTDRGTKMVVRNNGRPGGMGLQPPASGRAGPEADPENKALPAAGAAAAGGGNGPGEKGWEAAPLPPAAGPVQRCHTKGRGRRGETPHTAGRRAPPPAGAEEGGEAAAQAEGGGGPPKPKIDPAGGGGPAPTDLA